MEPIEAVNHNAYDHSCNCPKCGSSMKRDTQESIKFCSVCGTKIHIRAFTNEEINAALFEHEMDEYED